MLVRLTMASVPGKKDSGVPAIGNMSSKSLVRLCAKASASDLDALEEGHPLPAHLVENRDASIRDAFSHGAWSSLLMSDMQNPRGKRGSCCAGKDGGREGG